MGQRQLQWQWHWGRGTGAGATGARAMGQREQWQWCNGDRITIVLLYVVLQRKTSTIVVDETVQNVWTANIRDGSNKTCMMWSGKWSF
jgi:hypothetical protein